MDINEELQELLEKLRTENIPYALCGGFALAVYGIVRATEDIDLLIEEKWLTNVRTLAESLGFRFHRQALVFMGGDIQIYRLHKSKGADFLVLDLLLVSPVTRFAWDSQRVAETEFGPVRVVSPAGLIHLKSLRRSGQDEDDIRRLKLLDNES